MAKEKNPVNEVAIFCIGFGALIGIGAFFTLIKLGNYAELWGMRRCIALGAPLAVISACHLFAGIMLILTKSKWAIVLAILSAFLMAAFYFMFEISTIGFLKAKLMSVLAYALPILLIIRGKAAISHINTQNSQHGPSIDAAAQRE